MNKQEILNHVAKQPKTRYEQKGYTTVWIIQEDNDFVTCICASLEKAIEILEETWREITEKKTLTVNYTSDSFTPGHVIGVQFDNNALKRITQERVR